MSWEFWTFVPFLTLPCSHSLQRRPGIPYIEHSSHLLQERMVFEGEVTNRCNEKNMDNVSLNSCSAISSCITVHKLFSLFEIWFPYSWLGVIRKFTQNFKIGEGDYGCTSSAVLCWPSHCWGYFSTLKEQTLTGKLLSSRNWWGSAYTAPKYGTLA